VILELATKSAEDTRELGAALASVAEPSDVVVLAGDLGAGKTVLAQGFGRALGVTTPITSPTFVLAQVHRGRLTLVHADLYRLDRLAEVEDLALPELVDRGAVALVEWGDMAVPAFASEYLEVRLEPGASEDERRVRLRPVGERWVARHRLLREALGRFLAGEAGA
jgi:tRNA threonylcarbamoyladenosine biosynthesis protein TsaE